MSAPLTTLRNLRNLTQYLNRFNRNQRSIYFEKLIAETFSHILHLPFYTNDNDDPSENLRVTWNGSMNPISRAPGGGPDALAHCCNFHIIIEATQCTGARQWATEFAPSIRHCEDFCNQSGEDPNNIYILLVCTNLFRDTYRSVKANPNPQYKLIPIEVSELIKILETSFLAFTLRHLELRHLFYDIADCVIESPSFREYSSSFKELIKKWQVNSLESEKSTFIGVKSYEAMRKIGRNHIGISEILNILQKHWVVNRYFKIIGSKINGDVIGESLVKESLAFKLSTTYPGEKLFEPVPNIDFKWRYLRLIKTVERIG